MHSKAQRMQGSKYGCEEEDMIGCPENVASCLGMVKEKRVPYQGTHCPNREAGASRDVHGEICQYVICTHPRDILRAILEDKTIKGRQKPRE